MERMDASLERTIRNAADYLTELDCIQQTVEIECDKIQRRLASTREQELLVGNIVHSQQLGDNALDNIISCAAIAFSYDVYSMNWHHWKLVYFCVL